MRTLMNVLLLLIFLVMIFYCSPRPAPAGPPPSAPERPDTIVTAAGDRNGVPGWVMRAIWNVECSQLEIGQGPCRNLRTGERGAFQMRQAAAEFSAVGCNWLILGTRGALFYEADCAAKLLAHHFLTCRMDWDRAIAAYNLGHCPPRGKLTAYAKRALAMLEARP